MKFVRGKELPYIPASHEDLRNPGVMKRVLLSKTDFFPGAVQMVNWAELPPGNSFRKHYHEDMAEVFIMVRGEAVMRSGGQEQLLQEGDLAMIAPREAHEMINRGTEPAEYIVFGVSTGQHGKTIVVE